MLLRVVFDRLNRKRGFCRATRLQRIRKEEKGLICVKTYNITKDSTEKKLEYEKSYLNYDIALHHGVVSDDGIRSIIRF